MATLARELELDPDRAPAAPRAAGAARAARRSGRAPDRRHHPFAIAARACALSSEADRAAEALGRDRARADLSGTEGCCRRLAHDHLWRDARPGPPHWCQAAHARSVHRAADRDPFRQRHRARAARTCRHVCRDSLCPDLAGLCAGLDRLRQAQAHLRPADAGPGIRRRWSPVPARRRGGGAARLGNDRRPQPGAGPADHDVRYLAGADGHGAGRGRSCARGAGHHRQIPVHLGLDRRAQGGDQYPADVVLEPGDDPVAAGLLRG